MSWEWEIAMGIVAILLLVIAGRMSGAVNGLIGIAQSLNDAIHALQEQAKVLSQQNENLISISNAVAHLRSGGYVPPTVRFCDRCRKEFPESNRWWTAYQRGILPLKLCAYPQQKERPEDKWLHGEECVVAELRAYMAYVLHQRQQMPHKQKREYTEYDSEFRTSRTRALDVSHCGHCEKEYSESQFWWTVSPRGMEIEVSEGFKHSHSGDYYFCSEDCALAAVEIFIAAQPVTELTELTQEWEKYWADAMRTNLRAWLSPPIPQPRPPAQRPRTKLAAARSLRVVRPCGQ